MKTYVVVNGLPDWSLLHALCVNSCVGTELAFCVQQSQYNCENDGVGETGDIHDLCKYYAE